MSINYKQDLINTLYECIKAHEVAIPICEHVVNVDRAAVLDMPTRQNCVQVMQKCIDISRKTANACSYYLKHATETDSIARVQKVVETCNVCIKACEQIIDACDTISQNCSEMIAHCVNTLKECIDACRRAATFYDL